MPLPREARKMFEVVILKKEDSGDVPICFMVSAYKEKGGASGLDNEEDTEIVATGADHVGTKLGALISRWSNDNISMSKFL
jgi:hypothetical protein